MKTMLLDISEIGQRILRPCKWIATIAGCNLLYKEKFWSPLKIWNLFLLVTCSLGLMGQLHYLWLRRHQAFDSYVEAIIIVLQVLMTLWKLWIFTDSQDIMHDMTQSVQNSQILEDLEIFNLDLKDKHKIINEICHILKQSWRDIKMQLLVLRMTVFAICSWYSGCSLVINIRNFWFNSLEGNFYSQFPFPASFPIWYGHGHRLLAFIVEYFIITMEIYLATVASITYSGIFSVGSVHCLTLLRVLRKLISYSTTDHVPPEVRVKYMEVCIKLHQEILKFCNELNSLYKMSTLGLFAECCLVICMLTFKASLDVGDEKFFAVKVALYLSAALYELIVFCINGQRISSESDLLPFAIYDCLWYNEDSQFQFLTQIMILRSNHSIAMDAGGLARMSNVTLSTIIRSSVSYFLFLRNCM